MLHQWSCRALAVLGLLLSPGCLPLAAPHGEGRGYVGFTAGSTRDGAPDAVRLTGGIDVMYQPTQLLGCDREAEIALGARFHFVEPEVLGLHPARIGGVVSGAWHFVRDPNLRAQLRFDVDVLELDGRPLAGASVAIGFEVIGFVEGSGAWGGWEALFAGAWSGEAGLRAEAMVSYHEDFGGVHYATFTVGLTGRWPAGGGIALVNPIYLAVAAGQASSSSSSFSSAGSPSSSSSSSGSSSSGFSHTDAVVRRCPDLEPTASVDAAASPTAGGEVEIDPRVMRYRCHSIDDEADEEHVDADSRASAMRACEEMMDAVCVCGSEPELLLED